MSTVSTDLARRLASAGLQWEPKAGDWVQWGPGSELVTASEIGSPSVIRLNGRGLALVSDCLWLPTGDDCSEKIGQRLSSIQRSGWTATGYTRYLVEYWGNDGDDPGEEEAETLAEATGLALLAILEGEKAND